MKVTGPIMQTNIRFIILGSDEETWKKDLPIPNQILSPPGYAQTYETRFITTGETFNIVYNDNDEGQEANPDKFRLDGAKLKAVNLTNGSQAGLYFCSPY